MVVGTRYRIYFALQFEYPFDAGQGILPSFNHVLYFDIQRIARVAS